MRRLRALPFLCLPAFVQAQQQCSSLADKPVALVELYTSEGCSSCPPADQWLATLAKSPALAGKLAALALHVPYWDYIGWHDRFAQPQFEQRQRLAVTQRRSPTVYTPQIMLNGRDFQSWRYDLGPAVERLSRQAARASLRLSAQESDKGTQVSLTGSGPAGASLILVRYENGLSTQVQAGENAGVRLTHEHVARDWIALGSIPLDGKLAYSHTLPRQADSSGGLVAFAQDPHSGEILQAVTLSDCRSQTAGPKTSL